MQGKQATSSNQSSEEQDTSQNYSPRHKRNRFRVSLAPKEERHAALSRIQKALGKVSNKRSTKSTGERTSCDLYYVENLNCKADAQDLFDSIHYLSRMGSGIRLETTTVPLRKGCNRGYRFIKLSWDKDAPVDPDDICTIFTGLVKFNSRQVCPCKTNDTSIASPSASDRSGSDSDISAASESTSRDHSESESDEQTKAFFATYRKPMFLYRSFGYDSDGDSIDLDRTNLAFSRLG